MRDILALSYDCINNLLQKHYSKKNIIILRKNWAEELKPRDSLGKVGGEEKKQKKIEFNGTTGEKELSASLHEAWQMEEHKSL